MIAPNIPADCRALERDDTLNIGLRNNRGFSTGSDALVSQNTNTAHMATEKTSEPMIIGELHAYVLPAQLNASSSGTAATTRSEAPT